MADLVGLFLLVWFLISVLGQFPNPANHWLRAHDSFGLIPSWSFFAPNPARTDCHLVYRHILNDGEVTPWTEAFLWQPPWFRCLWNPDRRVEKAISDASAPLATRQDPHGVQWSTPYLLLLNHISALPRPTSAVSVQFALLGSFGPLATSPPFVRFSSDAHPIT